MFARLLGLSESELGATAFRLTVVLVASNLIWRSIRYGLDFPLFGDEAFVANNFLVRDFWGLTRPLEHYQIVPLLYLWLNLAVSKVMGDSEWSLRFIAYAAGIGSMLLFVRLSFKLLPAKSAVFAVAVFAASYFPVRHAAEVKPYATDLFVGLLLLYVLFAYLKSPDRRRWWVWAATSVIGCWASYPSIFVSGGICVVLFLYALSKRPPLLAPVTTVGVLTAASFGLMYWLIGSVQQSSAGEALTSYEAWALSFPPFSEPSRWPQWFLHTNLGELFAYPVGGEQGGSAITFILFCVGAWSLWRSGDRLKMGLLVSPFPLMFIAASFHAYPYGGNARVAQHVVPAICLLSAVGLVKVLRLSKDVRHMERSGWVFIGLCLFLIAGCIVRDLFEPYKERGDVENRAVAAELAREAGADTRLVVFGRWDGRASPLAPNLYDWAGHAARMRYYFERQSGLNVMWAPEIKDMGSLEGKRVWVLAYHHPFLQFPAASFRQYLRGFEERLGPYVVDTYPFKFKQEKLVVYRFEPNT